MDRPAMHARWSAWLLATLLCVAVCPATATAATREQRLDRAFGRSLERISSPGAQVAVLDDGELVYSDAAGVAIARPRERVSASSLFSFASFSKAIVAAYALDLVEQGRIGLDEPIAAYIGNAVAGSHRVTVRMLLTHTAGYPDIYSSSEMVRLFGERYDPNRHWTYRRVLGAVRPPRHPGRSYRYSNAAYIILSYVLRDVSDQPLHVAFEELLAPAGRVEPIDERSVTMRIAPAAADLFTHGYEVGSRRPDTFAGADLVPTDLYGMPWGDGLFAGTALGAAQFLDGLLAARGLLLGPRTVARMAQPTEQSRDSREPYGMGLYPIGAAGHRWIGHDGAYGGYTSQGFTDRRRGVTIAVLANGERIRGGGSPATAIWRALARAYDG